VVEMAESLLKVKVSKLGPIEEGEIELKPLTILFGKNNTGKTYIGYLLWGLASQKGYHHYLEPKTESYEKILQEFVNRLQNRKIQQRYPEFYEGLSVDYFLGEYTLNGLRAEIKRDFVKRLFNYPIEFEDGEIVIPREIKFSIGAIIKSDDVIHEYESLLVNQLRNRGYSVLFRHHRICIQIKVFVKAKVELKVEGKENKYKSVEKSKEIELENDRDAAKASRISIVITKDRKDVYHAFLILNFETYQNLGSNCVEVFEDVMKGFLKGLI
jgi:hypothetical protein